VEKSASSEDERLTAKTRKRHFSALGRLFHHLKEHSLVAENLARGFSFPRKGRANKKRQMWAGDALRKLFESPVWRGCRSKSRRSAKGDLVIRDDKYWLPLLGLFHGNRLEEFAQLRREDIKTDDEIVYFYINGEGGRQIKNEQSTRRVPMHRVVIELGFIEYVQAVAPNADDLVFPELLPGGPDQKLGFYFTKWFSKYRRDVGLYEKGLDYHSFRHGVTTKLFAANVSVPVVDELTGHEGSGTSSKVYKKDLPLPVLKAAIDAIEWPEVRLG
jgi:integrase